MKKSRVLIITPVTLCFAMSMNAMGDVLSKNDFDNQSKSIETTYDHAMENCESLNGNPKDICEAKAKGEKHVAKAKLDAANNPSAQTQFDVSLVQARADYNLAEQICDEKNGNAKDVCMKEAKAAKTHAEADAHALLEAQNADKKLNENDGERREDKNEADYKAAKEKCDAFDDDRKENCIEQAKNKYDQ